MFKNAIIARSVRILTKTEKKKVFGVILIQVFFGLLDLIGIALVGILGGLAITGVQAKNPGNRVSSVLQFLNLENLTLQSQATIIGLSAAVFLIVKTLFSVIFLRKTVFFLSRRSAAISADLISRVLAQPLVRVQSRSMQETLYAVTAGVDSIALGILNTSVLMISDTSLLLIIGVGLFVVDPVVAFTSLVIFSLIAILLYQLLQVRANELGDLQRKISIESSEKILEVLNSYREITVRNRRSYYVRQLGRLRFELANVNAERTFMPNISKYVIEITVVVGTLAIAITQFAIHDSSHAIAVLSVFLAASTRIAPAILRLQQGAIGIRSNVGAASPTLNLIEELLNSTIPSEVVDELDVTHKGFTGEIKLDNVSFTYPDSDLPAVEKISLHVKAGQVVSFVGPSGAGKTTLIDIILGVIHPDSGSVKIKGVAPLESIVTWPGAIGYVPQDVMISNGTIRENVCLGFAAENVDEGMIWEALQIAHLDDFVRNLPDGLDSRVGDRGSNLSGGQRQRLGIARAMLTKPKLLVLDEATSALDGSTEANISRAVNSLKGSVTVVMIAHRLSTVRESDVIHYMKNGVIEKSGTFEDLMLSVPEFNKQAMRMGR